MNRFIQSISVCFFFLIPILAFAQGFSGCIEIDFETIPGEATPYELLPISDQFYDQFGITFSLENGEIPVLAEVGGTNPAAFASSYGNDTPAPGQNVGRYFITDDGILSFSSLISPALILTFENPIDSFAGCILDLDFSESFLIEALDQAGNVLLDSTFRDGDPGTGDALSKCWGFNLEGCEGSVYAIKYSGTRTSSGGFGLGMDNFSFCINNFDFKKEDVFCTGELGSITMINLGFQELQYSLDGSPYQTDPLFDNLPVGVYLIETIDENGCESKLEVEILGPYFLEVDAVINPLSCSDNDASILINSNNPFTTEYSIDGINFSESSFFEGLTAGNYSIEIIDENGCDSIIQLTIAPLDTLAIESLETTKERCDQNNGSVMIFASGGTGEYRFSLDGIDFQSESKFSSLTSGTYEIIVRDENGCEAKSEFVIDRSIPLTIDDIEFENPDCFLNNGSITINFDSVENLMYALNDTLFQNSNAFDNLNYGDYSVFIEQEGCFIEIPISLIAPTCPIYIPNSFTPNGDLNNDFFKLSAHVDYGAEIITYEIYDRWGELIYKAGQFSIAFQEFWWDGFFNDERCENGVYVYYIQIRHPNQELEDFTGELTLIR